ncbi:hypothetical protein CBR_g3749 [Chara braunii]|uniref:CDK5RAP3-like protein n=1 Tax=Chara braunii TaxID=69332 RepID=A0A388KG82_CHABU|nr:hypothetical protein CBR_g3749 [Chara braunii]|eukprot:GBG69051.1 hypothetical protein CBR_g3749 [Chara braunii]
MVAEMATVEKVAEGVKFQESELPIDIIYSKLAEWLVDRKKIPAEWRKRLGVIQQKKVQALASLPRDVDTRLLTCTEETTGYLESKQIRDILAASKPEARTLFGRLSGAAGTWDEIVRLYERDSVYLGEAAHIMVQNTNYEIPYLRRQIAKWKHQLADLDRKEADYRRNAAASAQKFQQTCEELGIQGRDVKKELLELTLHLPDTFKDVSDAVCDSKVKQAVDYYRSFVAYAHTESGAEPPVVVHTVVELQSRPPEPAELSAIGRMFLAKATAKAYGKEDQNRPLNGTGEKVCDSDGVAPPSINWDIGSVDPAAELGSSTDDKPVEISWDIGELDLNQEPPDDLQVEGDTIASGTREVAGVVHSIEDQEQQMTTEHEIQWDIDVTDTALAAPLEIDWDIGIVVPEGIDGDGVSALQALGNEADGAGTGEVDGVARDETLPHALSTVEYRNMLVNDLFELSAFLRQRKLELSSSNGSAMLDQLQVSAPVEVQQHGIASLEVMDQGVSNALKLLTSDKTRNLIMLATSTRFLERLEKSVLDKKASQRKLLESVGEIEKKRGEVHNLLNATWPKHDAVLTRTRELKHLVEKTISSQYAGRPVHIIGEINNVLG